MKKTTHYLMVLVCLFAANKLSAQYYVTTSTGTYTDLVSPTVVATGPTFKTNYKANIPGSVTFFNKAYGTDHVSTQGEETNVFPTPAILVTEANSNNTNAEISVFGNCGVEGIDATSSVSYLVTGDAKTGTIKFQWKNMGLKGSGSPTDFINMQLWINRADKSFTIIMGPHQVTGTAAFGTHGSTCIGIDEYDGGFNSILASGYLKGDPTAPTVETGARSFTKAPATLSAIPAAGTTYQFKFNPHTNAVDLISGTSVLKPEIYPNPVSDVSHIKYAIPALSHVTITVTDISGKDVQIIADETKAEGIYENNIEKRSLKPGIYFCKINIGGVVRTEKMAVTQ